MEHINAALTKIIGIPKCIRSLYTHVLRDLMSNVCCKLRWHFDVHVCTVHHLTICI